MPELPEVEKVRSLTEKYALNKVITKVKAFEDEIVFVQKTASSIERALENAKVTAVRRKGKIFWMETEGGSNVSFHLGMTGRMLVRGNGLPLQYYRYPDKNENGDWPPRFAKLVLTMDDGTEMAYTNTRRLGRVRLHRRCPSAEEPISLLGIDPLNAMCSRSEFAEILLRRKCPLKAALLNQSIIAGVGNWIADEVCYQSGVYNGKYCNLLTPTQIERLYHSLQHIVSFAVSVEANYSKFPSNWLFHYRWNKAKKSPKRKNTTKSATKSKAQSARNGKKSKSAEGAKSDHNDVSDEFKNAHCDSFANAITYEQVGGRTTAVVYALQSKGSGFRMFQNERKVGPITTYKAKVKRRGTNRCPLIEGEDAVKAEGNEDGGNDNKVSTRRVRRKSRKRRLEEAECSGEQVQEIKDEKPSKGRPRKKRRISYDPTTHVLNCKNVLIPIGMVRRSSRLAKKRSLR